MSTDFSDFVQSALALPLTDRARLASALLRSLDPEVESDSALIAEEWQSVILARSDALHQGTEPTVEGQKVVEELRSKISDSAANGGP